MSYECERTEVEKRGTKRLKNNSRAERLECSDENLYTFLFPSIFHHLSDVWQRNSFLRNLSVTFSTALEIHMRIGKDGI